MLNKYFVRDSQTLADQTRHILPLRRLMEQRGRGPSNDNWKRFPKCPYCHKDGAGLVQDGEREWFKCFHANCPSSTAGEGGAWDEVRFLAYELGLSPKEAFVTWLKEAGTWKDPVKRDEAGLADTEVQPHPADTSPQTAPAGIEPGRLNIAAASDGSAAPDHEIPEPAQPPREEKTTNERPGYRVLEAFFQRLSWSPKDDEACWRKRGLSSRTCAALRFRSNPRSNRDILLELLEAFGWEEVQASGLWLPEQAQQGKDRRPNSKFCGYGKVGKKPNNDDWEYAWNEPILIPYFDEADRLVGLRPHKDMGPAGTIVGTPQLYVPRSLEGAPEKFAKAVITEAEFKAAALWQVLGAGRSDGLQPLGVAAIPGISFGKNYEMREMLDDWLRAVHCRHLIVAFDNEEKGDPELTSFKADRRKRFDAHIWAAYLATDLARKLHLRASVCVLPDDWRNAQGKADWDSALARMLHGKTI